MILRQAQGIRIKLAFAACTLLFSFSVAAHAQQAKKVARMAYLTSNSSASELSRLDPFRKALRSLGYIEGQNVAFEYRYADGKFERLPAMVAELLRQKLDLLVVATTNAALVARDAKTTIPVVFVGVSDPVAAGLVDSLAQPRGNMTG